MDREFSSGGVVFKKVKKSNKDNVLWLVTKSTPSKKFPNTRWRLPKGRLDDTSDDKPGLLASGGKKANYKNLVETAIKEVEEEGGVIARVIEKIETIKYVFKINDRKVFKFVTFFLMEYLKESPGGFGDETSEIKWLSYQKARKILSFSNEKKVLDSALKALQAKEKQPNLI